MNSLLGLLALLITLAGGLVMGAAALSGLWLLARSGFSSEGLDGLRRRLAEGIISALGLMTAATLLRSLMLESWSAIGLFALVLSLRLLIKRSLGQGTRPSVPAFPRREPVPAFSEGP